MHTGRGVSIRERRAPAPQPLLPARPWTADGGREVSASRRRYFVVSQFAGWTFPEDSEPSRAPRSLIHAKEMGTTRTACGIACTTWAKFWDLRFPMTSKEVCSECLAITIDPAVGPIG